VFVQDRLFEQVTLENHIQVVERILSKLCIHRIQRNLAAPIKLLDREDSMGTGAQTSKLQRRMRWGGTGESDTRGLRISVEQIKRNNDHEQEDSNERN
jgi:hypothetical protein